VSPGPRRVALPASGLRPGNIILKTAVQPRMETDGHGYKLFLTKVLLHPAGEANSDLKIVFIRVYPWFIVSLCVFNCGI
jgi:hypothetical protein